MIRALVEGAPGSVAGFRATSKTGDCCALLLQAFYTIRERQLTLDYNLLFRWFVGLSMDERVWDATVYSKNRDRLVAGDVAARLLQAVLLRRLLSEEHFSVSTAR